MERKGFTRQSRTIAIAAVSCGMLASVAGFSAPMAAAQTSTWTMPSLRNEILQDAVDSVVETAGEGNVEFNFVDSQMNQVVYNFTNWVVCGQSPSAGKSVKIADEPQTVTLALKRPLVGC